MDNQLKVLEERINKAIAFIENLKAKEKKLLDEKETVEQKILVLETEMEEKERTIEELMENQVFLKNRIEAVLNKLESLANFEISSTEEEVKPEELSTEAESESGGIEKTAEKVVSSGSGEIYVEENIVDLKSEDEEVEIEEEFKEKGESTKEVDDAEKSLKGRSTPRIDQKPLFDSEDSVDKDTADSSEESDVDQNIHLERRPFSENPFIEM